MKTFVYGSKNNFKWWSFSMTCCNEGTLIYFGCNAKACYLKFPFVGSVCDSVGRVVASNNRGPWFESSHWQDFIMNTFTVNCCKIKRKNMPGTDQFNKVSFRWRSASRPWRQRRGRRRDRSLATSCFETWRMSHQRERQTLEADGDSLGNCTGGSRGTMRWIGNNKVRMAIELFSRKRWTA